ncbi:MAG: thioredoxin-dependent thiol peroxidase [Gemmatimonadota bacterium]|jgi:peroxiredoxin Q/BCP|nr:thioredoxin-dependent thiol peroxidase [Gemmatimonadota bacterium]MDQ8147263.1 thioredoxin-dependent thiol peroxidase [Gemmatimonadota bacterium]MDQ8156281.1 thioredoxin-dependent thiol peroxidase [Gemmatimonadota bacterium]
MTIGRKAPAFRLQDDTGAWVDSASLKGKRVVLFFYPKDMTSGCTVEACEFRDLMPRFTASNAVIYGVSPDPVASHQKFRAKERLPYGLLSDPTHALCEAYGVWVEKSLYGRKYMGVHRSTFVVGVDGTLEMAWRGVKPEGHAAEVNAWLRGEAAPVPATTASAKKPAAKKQGAAKTSVAKKQGAAKKPAANKSAAKKK